jgi:hypothetical protein
MLTFQWRRPAVYSEHWEKQEERPTQYVHLGGLGDSGSDPPVLGDWIPKLPTGLVRSHPCSYLGSHLWLRRWGHTCLDYIPNLLRG